MNETHASALLSRDLVHELFLDSLRVAHWLVSGPSPCDSSNFLDFLILPTLGLLYISPYPENARIRRYLYTIASHEYSRKHDIRIRNIFFLSLDAVGNFL